MQIPMQRNEEKKVGTMKYKNIMNSRERRNLWLSRIVIWIVLVIVLFPVVSIIAASLAKGASFTQTSLWPKEITFDNYKNVISKTDFIIWTKNSLKVCFSVAFIQLALTIPAAFAFSKFRFKLRSKGLLILLILQMFPAVMSLPAILRVAYRMNGMDHLWVLILILCGGNAYNIWLMKGYIDGIPDDLVEAARVDGATNFQVFIKIILPLMRNMILVIFLFSFITAYSEYVFSSALLKDPGVQTLATGMQGFIRDKYSSNWTTYSAAAIMSSLPVVILFMSLQKFIAKGITAGSVKE